jgi:hypothetical protein
MKYFRKAKSLERHLARLQTRQPPGQSQQLCCLSIAKHLAEVA